MLRHPSRCVIRRAHRWLPSLTRCEVHTARRTGDGQRDRRCSAHARAHPRSHRQPTAVPHSTPPSVYLAQLVRAPRPRSMFHAHPLELMLAVHDIRARRGWLAHAALRHHSPMRASHPSLASTRIVQTRRRRPRVADVQLTPAVQTPATPLLTMFYAHILELMLAVHDIWAVRAQHTCTTSGHRRHTRPPKSTQSTPHLVQTRHRQPQAASARKVVPMFIPQTVPVGRRCYATRSPLQKPKLLAYRHLFHRLESARFHGHAPLMQAKHGMPGRTEGDWTR